MVIELTLERRLVSACKKRGMLCIKLQGAKGIPDRMVLAPGGAIAFLELKKPREGVIAPMQKWWGARINTLGFEVGIFDNWTHIERLLNTLSRGRLPS